MVSFHYRVVDGINFTFENWLKSILANLETLAAISRETAHLLRQRHSCVLLFQLSAAWALQDVLLDEFRVLKNENFRGVKFSPGLVSAGLVAVGNKIWKHLQ